MSAETTGPQGVPGDPSGDLLERRIRAATSLRRLGNALVGHDADPQLLDRIAQLADATAETVEQGPSRNRPVDAIKRRLWEEGPADGQPMSHFDECVVSGKANPMGIAMSVQRDGDQAVADVRLGPAFEGAPQRAHGGITAAVFDDVMGYVLVLLRTPAYTGKLTVSYRAPVPVNADLQVRGWLERRDGRKLFMRAEMTHDGTVISDAEGLFIAIPLDKLGLTPELLAQLGAES